MVLCCNMHIYGVRLPGGDAIKGEGHIDAVVCGCVIESRGRIGGLMRPLTVFERCGYLLFLFLFLGHALGSKGTPRHILSRLERLPWL